MFWGCKNLIHGFSTHVISSANARLDFRFTSPGNVNLTSFNIHVVAINGSPPKMNFTLYSDNNGVPGNILTTHSVAAGTGFRSTEGLNYNLVSGQVYHCAVKGQSGHDISNNHVIRLLNRNIQGEV